MFRRMEILQYFKVVPQYCTWVTFHHCICPDAGFYPLCHYIHITDVLFIKHHRHHLVDILWECSHPCTTVVIHLINSILIFDFLSLRSFKIWRFRCLWGCSLKISQYYFYPTVCWPTFYCIKRQNKKNKKQMRMFSVHHLVKFRISWCHFITLFRNILSLSPVKHALKDFQGELNYWNCASETGERNSPLPCATSVPSHLPLRSSALSIRAKGVELPSIFATLRDVSLLINCCLIAAVAAPC